MKKIRLIFIVYVLMTCITYNLLCGINNLLLPSFSIIVSSYNYGHFLPDTIESVMRQSYKRWELILVNDGSTDNTLNVMQRYAQKDNRIKIIDQENQGLSMARNNAMKIAKGDYIWFVDADDFIDKNALFWLSEKIKKTNYPDMVSFLFQPVDVYKTKLNKDFCDKLPTEFSYPEYEVFNGRDLSMGTIYSYPASSGKQIYKRKLIEDNDIQFISKLYFEDEVFFMTALQANARVTTLMKRIYYRRLHSISITANRHKYYPSVVKLPMLVYAEAKRVGGNEDILRELFSWHLNGVFHKYPHGSNAYLSDLKALADWVERQPQDDFWKSTHKRITDFIREKEETQENN